MPRVALFVTCLVDILRPRVGVATVQLLEDAGCTVEVPRQSCCGQPNYNSGDRMGAARIARAQIRAFAGFDYVVAPSGSCAAMVKRHYANLFDEGTEDRARAEELARRCFEITSFLHDVLQVDIRHTSKVLSATYHDSCSGLRELDIKKQPRALLSSVKGLALKEMHEAEACCGFGGTFCVKYPEISGRIADEKITNIKATAADCVIAGDVGCILNIEGKMHRDGFKTPVYHVAEVLAGLAEEGH